MGKLVSIKEAAFGRLPIIGAGRSVARRFFPEVHLLGRSKAVKTLTPVHTKLGNRELDPCILGGLFENDPSTRPQTGNLGTERQHR